MNAKRKKEILEEFDKENSIDNDITDKVYDLHLKKEAERLGVPYKTEKDKERLEVALEITYILNHES